MGGVVGRVDLLCSCLLHSNFSAIACRGEYPDKHIG